MSVTSPISNSPEQILKSHPQSPNVPVPYAPSALPSCSQPSLHHLVNASEPDLQESIPVLYLFIYLKEMRFQLWHIRTAKWYVAISNDGAEENLMRWKNVHNIFSGKKRGCTTECRVLQFLEKKVFMWIYMSMTKKYLPLNVLSGHLGTWAAWWLQTMSSWCFSIISNWFYNKEILLL